jgi:hypothetical protein
VSYTQEQATTLRDAIARGVRRVKMNGEEVEYQSLAEMRGLLAEMERALAPVAPTRRHYPNVTRGT